MSANLSCCPVLQRWKRPPQGRREGVIGPFFGREGVIARKNGREGVIEKIGRDA